VPAQGECKLSIYGEAQKLSAFREVLEEKEVQRTLPYVHVILGKLPGGAWP